MSLSAVVGITKNQRKSKIVIQTLKLAYTMEKSTTASTEKAFLGIHNDSVVTQIIELRTASGWDDRMGVFVFIIRANVKNNKIVLQLFF